MNEEKGFTIKDRRSFDQKGDPKDREAGPERTPPAEKPPEAEAPGGAKESPPPPLPEVNFNSLIFSLSSSALLHLGEIADPQSGKRQKDLPVAKHAIDTISLLKEKTKGNLNDEETRFLDSVLNDLRWRFVRAAK